MVFGFFKRFFQGEHGEATMSTALIVSVSVMVMAILAVPFIDNISRQFSNPGANIDYTITSSAGNKSKPDRYVVRKSILDDTQPQPFPAD